MNIFEHLWQIIFTAGVAYICFFIFYWKWRLMAKYIPGVEDALKDIFRFCCWLLGIKYKN